MENFEIVNSFIDKNLDCYGGTDGGLSFLTLKINMENLAKKADSGDKTSIEIVDIIRKFSRLFDFLSKDEIKF